MSSTETMEIRQLARQFAESELRPHVEQWDHDRAFDPAVIAQLAELGFFGMLVPESHGGMEFDLPTYVSALEEIAWGEPAVAYTLALTCTVGSDVLRYGSESQKRQWLESIAQGETIACRAYAEEDGSTVQAAASIGATTLNGTKRWVTNARLAKIAAVQAGNKVYLVPTDTPGFNIGERAATLGFRPVEITDVELANVRVDADSAFEPTEQFSTVASIGTAAIAVGIAQAAFDHARGYADVREQFKEKLRNFEGIQFKLADMAAGTEAARALLQQAAAEPTPALVAMAKVFASENAMSVTTQAVQIYGGYGYMRDYPVEKLMRDAKATEIMEGVNELQRVLIARELYT